MCHNQISSRAALRFGDASRGREVGVARIYVGRRAIAEEVVQEAWVAMFRGLDKFEGRSSLKTWLFSILVRRARSVGVHERRSEPVSQLVGFCDDQAGDSAERFFHGEGHPDVGAWAMPPLRWRRSPESVVLGQEVRLLVEEAIDALPEMQRLVVFLSDVEGWEAGEIARHLERTRNWVRVVLHRGRFKVRAAIEEQLGVRE